MAGWAWMPIVIGAALMQTIRNAAQRSLVTELGALAATLVRFLYGLPSVKARPARQDHCRGRYPSVRPAAAAARVSHRQSHSCRRA